MAVLVLSSDFSRSSTNCCTFLLRVAISLSAYGGTSADGGQGHGERRARGREREREIRFGHLLQPFVVFWDHFSNSIFSDTPRNLKILISKYRSLVGTTLKVFLPLLPRPLPLPPLPSLLSINVN